MTTFVSLPSVLTPKPLTSWTCMLTIPLGHSGSGGRDENSRLEVVQSDAPRTLELGHLLQVFGDTGVDTIALQRRGRRPFGVVANSILECTRGVFGMWVCEFRDAATRFPVVPYEPDNVDLGDAQKIVL